MEKGFSRVTVILVLGMLLTGSINTISKKMGYATCSTGMSSVDSVSSDKCHGHEKLFKKPWTQTLVMFLGESMCLLLFAYKRYQARRQHPSEEEANASPVKFRSIWVCLIPAICDLGGTTLSGIGLLFTAASVFQMLRGSIIVFAAIFSVLFLKRRVYRFQWTGIVITVGGIVIVGASSYLSSSSSSMSDSTTLVMLGNVLVILSQIMSAFQMVVEEKYLKGRNLPPEFVIGCEGAFGALMMVAVVLPLVGTIPFHTCHGSWCKDGNGVHENALDAATMLGNNGFLLFLVLLYWVSIAFYNFCGLSLSKKLSSVHRTLVDACRTVVVWVANIILWYATDGQYGEKWVTKTGLLQLLGFSLMVFGTLIHNKVLRFPKLFVYPDVTTVTTVSQTPSLAQPLLEPRSRVSHK
eukprot:c7896_g1_i1.p1 GENE.c7896_g1_i1~~c7896_g1_i1.p1  ORF type:complete len:409 (-),score=105.16 c7896_g1_i1:25-1251(-)